LRRRGKDDTKPRAGGPSSAGSVVPRLCPQRGREHSGCGRERAQRPSQRVCDPAPSSTQTQTPSAPGGVVPPACHVTPRRLAEGGAQVRTSCGSQGPRSPAALRVHTRSPFPPPPTARMMCGAPSATQPATAETQAIADQVKSQLEEKENKKFPIFKAVEFRSQVVAGTNHFIKTPHLDEVVCPRDHLAPELHSLKNRELLIFLLLQL
uniref:Cystatin domain-containing protein n=1 Tax=Equus caballus TaxID=9796 RepID=A0A9L0TLD4_HORSE